MMMMMIMYYYYFKKNNHKNKKKTNPKLSKKLNLFLFSRSKVNLFLLFVLLEDGFLRFKRTPPKNIKEENAIRFFSICTKFSFELHMVMASRANLLGDYFIPSSSIERSLRVFFGKKDNK